MTRYLNIAIKEAKKSNYDPYRLGAIVLHKRRIVSKGFNSHRVHGRLNRLYGQFYTQHAECDALLRAAKGDVLLVVRIDKADNITCSRPCKRCIQMAKKFGIKKILFTNWDASIAEIIL